MSRAENKTNQHIPVPNEPALVRLKWPLSIAIFLLGGAALLSSSKSLSVWNWQLYDSMSAARESLAHIADKLGIRGNPLQVPSLSDQLIHIYIEESDWGNSPNPTESQYHTLIKAVRAADKLGAKTIGVDRVLGNQNETLNQELKQAIDSSIATVVLNEYLEYDHKGAPTRTRSMPSLERYEIVGLTNLETEVDGVYRQYRLGIPHREVLEPSFALACYAAQTDLEPIPTKDGIELLSFSSETLQFVHHSMIESGSHPLKFLSYFDDSTPTGRKTTITHLSFKDLLEISRNANNEYKALSNKLVVISFQIAGANLGTTTIGSNQPLISLHLNAINQLLSESETSIASDFANIGALAFGIFAFSLLTRNSKRNIFVSIIWFLSLSLLLGISFWAYDFYFQNALLLALFALLASGDLARRYFKESIAKTHLQTTLGPYFSPLVFREILNNPGKLEPKETELTVLISDLRNFTSLCEELDASLVFKNISRSFDIQAQSCLSHSGHLEQIVGDQFLAYWGAPHAIDNPADHSFAALNEILAALQNENPNWDPEFAKRFGIGFALHTGVGLVGNKGTQDRMNYGILGDLVNTTARMESLTKEYGVQVLVSKAFIQKMKDPPPARLIGRFLVKGKSIPIEVFEPKTVNNRERFEERSEAYGRAFSLYENEQSNEALHALENPLLANDGPSNALKKKIETALETI